MKCSDKEWQHCQKEKRGCEGCAYNDEIKENEYIRSNTGEIGKVIEIKENPDRFVIDDYGQVILKVNVVKHSFDILDLLEDDDFIIIAENGYPLQIRTIWKNGGELNIRLSNEMIFEDIKNDKEFDIKSILTKEIFEANVYKLEE